MVRDKLAPGDTIKCGSAEEAIELMTELAKEDIDTDFLYEKDGEKGLWPEVLKPDNYITLLGLLTIIGDCENEIIQVCHEDSWDKYDEFHTGSLMLKPFYHLRVISVGAVGENALRVDLDWSGMDGH